MPDFNSTRTPLSAKPKKSDTDAPVDPDNKPTVVSFTTYDVGIVEALEHLLHEARRGQVIGLAYGAMLRQQRTIADSVGELERNPLTALGMLTVLQAQITKRMKLS